MSNYYSQKQYEGDEVITVVMDIGTTQSERGRCGWGESDPMFRCCIVRPFHSRHSPSRPNGIFMQLMLCSISPSGKVAHWPGQPYWVGGSKVGKLSYTTLITLPLTLL